MRITFSAAENEPAPSRPAVGGDDQQINPFLFGQGDDFVRRAAVSHELPFADVGGDLFVNDLFQGFGGMTHHFLFKLVPHVPCAFSRHGRMNRRNDSDQEQFGTEMLGQLLGRGHALEGRFAEIGGTYDLANWQHGVLLEMLPLGLCVGGRPGECPRFI